jgi:cell division protein FtsZ
MSGAGSALMGIGSARGEGRAIQAAEKAINSPLLEASMDGAHGALLSIAGGSDLGLFEINEAASLVQESAHPDANIIFGTIIDDSLGDEVRVTVIAAGFDAGTPTHKKLDPSTFGSRGSTASAASGQVGGGATPVQSQQNTGAVGDHTRNGYPVAPPRTHSSIPAAGNAPMSGGLPQGSAAGRGYPARGASPTQGSLPGRAMPVHDDPADDEVDVPPFMRR